MSKVCSYLSNGTLTLSQIYGNICSELKGGFRHIPPTDEENIDNKNKHKKSEQPTLKFYSINAPVEVQFNVKKSEFVIGKNASQVDGAVTFNKAISRVHCKITYQNNTYFITDLGSANGTYVNKSRIVSHSPHPIKSGDIIRLANSDFTVEM
jgi:pSer/pThr/pTyr-binding forkhead associated (FHA) protein